MTPTCGTCPLDLRFGQVEVRIGRPARWSLGLIVLVASATTLLMAFVDFAALVGSRILIELARRGG